MGDIVVWFNCFSSLLLLLIFMHFYFINVGRGGGDNRYSPRMKQMLYPLPPLTVTTSHTLLACLTLIDVALHEAGHLHLHLWSGFRLLTQCIPMLTSCTAILTRLHWTHLQQVNAIQYNHSRDLNYSTYIVYKLRGSQLVLHSILNSLLW